MGGWLADHDVLIPADLREALDALASGGKVVPLAGGTDLMVYLDAGTQPACTFLNLDSLAELRGSARLDGQLTLHALTAFREVRSRADIARAFPLLPRAAREVGVLAIQSRATWAGNVANASPAADGVPALLAYDAELELSSAAGSRRVPLARFYHGYKRLELRPAELITAIRLPAPPAGRVEYFRKVGARRLQAISKTLLAGWMDLDTEGVIRDLRLALGSVAPYPLRAVITESVLRGQELTERTTIRALEALQDEIHPIDDIRSTERYRRAVSGNLLREFLGTHVR